jgi:putative ABC transport system ATP-binding protein
MSEAVIRLENLGKNVTDATGTWPILSEVSFSLAPKETAAIVGASGSGKSTLLSLMAGLDTPSAGRVFWGEQDLFALGEDARAQLRVRSMGFVFQSFQLLGHLSALENVMLPLELTDHPNPKREAQEMLARVGLSTRLSQYPKVLSGGEQQRVALARALVLKPKMLMADEPTGSLDHATGETILALMLEMNQELGTTLVLVTHDEGLAARMDRRLHLQAGRLVRSSSAHEGEGLGP